MERSLTSLTVEYANTSLPKNPFLAPWLHCIDFGDGRLQFRGSQFSFTLSHPLFVNTFLKIRDLLNGDHQIEEIASSGGEAILPTTIIFVLKILRANGILHEFHPFFTSFNNLEKRRAVFLSQVLQDPGHSIEVFSQSRIGLIGDSSLIDEVRESLGSIGINEIFLPSFESLKKTVETEKLDFLIVCKESPSFSFYEKINSKCLDLGIRWMHVTMDGTSALIGPTIVPFQTACYKCFTTRIEFLVPDLEGYVAFKKEQNQTSRDNGYFSALGKTVGSQVAMEIARIYLGFSPPKTFGRYYQFNINDMESVGHSILRFPRCSACYNKKSPLDIWDSSISAQWTNI